MCGINCIVSDMFSDRIGEMNDLLSHRGPDHCGVVAEGGISLSLSRLAILDLSEKGNQPMEYEGHSIAYNGEVYNYQHLRDELQEDGISFESDTDTEVVLKGFVERGVSFLDELNGIVGVVIYDRDSDRLTLYRDRAGIKPLYYRRVADGIIISSELKTIVEAFPELDLTVDARSATSYFSSRTIEGESLYEEIEAVHPGTALHYDIEADALDSEPLTQLYDHIDRSRFAKHARMDESAVVDAMDRRLNEAVQRQLIADVPIAAICSGGVDSSLIAAIAAQYSDAIDLYHVSVDHPGLDEHPYAKQVADHLGLDLIVEHLDGEKFEANLDDCIYHNGLPPVHINTVGMGLIFERVQEDGVKVLLTGEGADELFGGYSRYAGLYYLMLLNSVNPVGWLIDKLPRSDQLPFTFLNSGDHVLNHFLSDRHQLAGEDTMAARHRQEVIEELEARLSHVGNGHRRKSLAYMASDMVHFLPPLLRRTDRMSMRMSVEARVPYLDNELLDFGLNLPHKYKVRRGESKYLLKKVAERYLPSEIVYRQKSGFHLPITDWIDTEDWSRTDDPDSTEILYRRWSEIYNH